MTGIQLSELLTGLPVEWHCLNKMKDSVIHAIQFDSRKVTPGGIFVAMSGGAVDGHDYISSAIERGAVAIVGTRELTAISVPYIRVADSRETLAYLAAAFHDFPGRKLTVIGVTGTDGKTTTSNILYQILKTAGYKVGMISTVNAIIGDEVVDTGFHVTTPEAPDVQEYLARMVAAGLTHVVLETTSHGLAQHRVTGCEYDIAVVTNITHEHLDYHGSYDGYLNAKAMLFSSLALTAEKPQGNPRLAVLNRDDQSFQALLGSTPGNVMTYGVAGDADLIAKNISSSPAGVDFTVVWHGQQVPSHFNIPGKFNVSNCLAALGAALSLGIDLELAVSGLSKLSGVPGRMEPIEMGQTFAAIVDFAHTPNALKRAVETAREMTNGSVIAVFGSAGLRDKLKRRMMAEVSIHLADITILTAEDPRIESLDAILEEMADSARETGGIEGKTFYRVPDRGDAIRLGVQLAQRGDLVMACGKGHEQSMCFGTTEYSWDDRTAMRAALAELLNLPGYPMPVLPTSR